MKNGIRNGEMVVVVKQLVKKIKNCETMTQRVKNQNIGSFSWPI